MEWGIQFWAKLICVRVILYSSYPLRCVFMCATDEHPSHWVLLVCFYTLEGFPLLIHQRVQARKHLGWLLEYIYMYICIIIYVGQLYIYIYIHTMCVYIYIYWYIYTYIRYIYIYMTCSDSVHLNIRTHTGSPVQYSRHRRFGTFSGRCCWYLVAIHSHQLQRGNFNGQS